MNIFRCLYVHRKGIQSEKHFIQSFKVLTHRFCQESFK